MWNWRHKFGWLALVLVSCTVVVAQPGKIRRSSPARSAKPNILLVTIDTLRADHLGCYGAPDVQTPAIDALAREGILFERAISQVPLTWPSHASILTGTYPFHNGVQDFTGQPLSPEFRTVAQALKANGYATSAVVSSFVLDRSWGLARGFDSYDDAFKGSDFLNKDLALVERRAGESVDHAIASLTKPQSRPFFLWLHLYDPHSPYDAPEPFRTRYKDRPYDGEISYADSELGRLFTWLKKKALYSGMAIIVLSDHGESLGEHGEREHGFFIYNSTVHVPLIIKLPGSQRSHSPRVSRPVEIASVAPTLLEIAGVHDAIQKQFDVSSLLSPPRTGSVPVAYSETFYPFSSFGWSPLRGVQSEDYHFIEAPRPELYDLPSDAAEKKNIASTKDAMRGVMQSRLREVTGRVPQRALAGSPPGLDPAAQEKLRALGYVSFRAPVQARDLDRLADPKDKADEFEMILSAADAFRDEAFDKGRALLAPVEKSDPQMYLVPFMLGEASLRQRDWAAATANFRKALALNPSFDQAMTGVARSLFEQGNSDEATAWVEKAIQQNGQNVRAWYELGWIQTRSAPDKAAQSLEKCVELQPNFAPARRDLGMIYIRGQKYEEAAKQLLAAADLGLNEPKLFNFLGIAYSRTNRLKEAVASYRRALKLDPTLAEAHLNLGFAYQRLKRVDEARNEYSEACRLESRLCSVVPP